MLKLSNRRFAESSNRPKVDWWNCGVLESFNRRMVETGGVVESLNRRMVEWWNSGVVESLNRRMVELSNRRMVEC